MSLSSSVGITKSRHSAWLSQTVFWGRKLRPLWLHGKGFTQVRNLHSLAFSILNMHHFIAECDHMCPWVKESVGGMFCKRLIHSGCSSPTVVVPSWWHLLYLLTFMLLMLSLRTSSWDKTGCASIARDPRHSDSKQPSWADLFAFSFQVKTEAKCRLYYGRSEEV